MNEQTKPDNIVSQNREAMALIPVDERGVTYTNFLQIADRARALAKGRASVAGFLKGNEPDCIAVVELSVGWGFQPAMVAPLVYEVNGRMGFMAQLLHAIINKSGILKGRLRFSFEGEGDERRCTCSGTFRDDGAVATYSTAPFAKISPKNSPLWKTDPDQQMTYLALSRWVKRHSPEVFLGCYTREELEDAEPGHFGPDEAKDVTAAANALQERIAKAKAANGDKPAEGFRDGVVEDGLMNKLAESVKLVDQEKAGKPGQVKVDQGDGKGAIWQDQPAAGEPKGAAKPKGGRAAKAKAEKRTSEPPKGTVEAPSGPIPPPTSPGAYRAHVANWLAELDDEEEIEFRWGKERALRNQCGVTEEVRLKIKSELVDPRIAEIRG